MTDWLKTGAMPPETISNEEFATSSGVVGPLDTSTSGDADTDALEDELDTPAGTAPTGQSATASGGGYGSPSGRGSAGSGEATPESSDAGEDDQTDWLRDAPGGSPDAGGTNR
ncbi:MAG: hypothetical protein ACJ77B_10470 [Chloroflexota bacterium]